MLKPRQFGRTGDRLAKTPISLPGDQGGTDRHRYFFTHPVDKVEDINVKEPIQITQTISVLRIDDNPKIVLVICQRLIRGVVGIGRPNDADLFFLFKSANLVSVPI